MRILYISGETVPGSVGGSIHVWEVAKNLKESGHEVLLLVNKHKSQKIKEIIDEIKVYRTNNKIFGMTFPIMHIKKFFSIKKIDAIIERYSVVGGFGAILSKLYNIPLIIEINGPHLYESEYLGKIKNKYLSTGLKKWSHFQFSQSKYILAPVKEIVPEEHITKFKQIEWGVNENIFVKNNYVLKKAKSIKKQLDVKNRMVFLFHGSFRAWHGIEMILQAAETLKCEKIQFILIGHGNLSQLVKEVVQNNKLDNITLIDKVSYEDLPAYISIADFGLAPFNSYKYQPLRFFGFYWSPLKLFEYMSMELPILTSNIERIKKLIGKNNFFFKEGDVTDFIKKIRLLQIIKKNKLHSIGTQNRKIVLQKYTWRKHVEKVNKLLVETR